MSSILGAAKTLELVNNLKGFVRDFASREEKINAEFRVQISAEIKIRERATEQLARELAGQTEAVEAAHQIAQEAITVTLERRAAVIREAHKTSKKWALENIDNLEARQKFKLQSELLQADRDREAGLAAAETAYEEYKLSLAEHYNALLVVEQRAKESLKRYRKFLPPLTVAAEKAPSDPPPTEIQLLSELHELIDKTNQDLIRFQKSFLPFISRYLPLWLSVSAGLFALPYALEHFGNHSLSHPNANAAAGGLMVLSIILYVIGLSKSAPAASAINGRLARAHELHPACGERCESHHVEEIARIESESQNRLHTAHEQWELAVEEYAQRRVSSQQFIDDKAARVSARNERLYQGRLDRLNQERAATIARLTEAHDARQREILGVCEAKESQLNEACQSQWQAMETEWRSKIQPLYDVISRSCAAAQTFFPPWNSPALLNWTPPQTFEQAAKFAYLEVNVERLADALPKDQRLALPGPSRFQLPVSLIYPQQGSVLFETRDTGREQVIGALNNTILRLLSTAPPGRLSFTVIDPVGLGQNFAGVMHLADYADHLINGRIWTQAGQIDQRLTDLNEHMEKVIQMYLRNDYDTIADYNKQAGNIAEKYHFLVVADFPSNFNESAIKRLLSIANSGAKCGVYTLIHWDTRLPLPPDFAPEDLRKSSICISVRGKEFLLAGKAIPGAAFVLEAPPDPNVAIDFIHKVGKASRDSNRVEVPFAHIAPAEADLWSVETTTELRVPIGRTGATKLQYLAIGKGTRQHALIAGKTGSGKSTLFHVIISNLALWCSPEQVEFYLIDFKKGVEFKCYATRRLPHARVVAIESDREFGLSVLQKVDEELKRRGDLFRKLGVQDVAGYKRAGGTEPVPRSLLMIDEFQEFFVEDDKIAQGASLLLDRIVRQGRAFGIHVILGSQTLGGAYSMARTTLGQMVIRIALQCNEADAYLIMDENNPAPRLLSRPGEGIYNDAAGAMEGNSPFQAVWLPDNVRDNYLEIVRNRADQTGVVYPGPIVFEGDAPAEVRENPLLQGLLQAETIKPAHAARIWLGAPNSIKGPTEAILQRQSGNHLLLVGQREEATQAILCVSLIALAAQYPLGTARFILLDGTAPGSTQRDYIEQIVQAIPHPITLARNADLGEILTELANEMKRRVEEGHGESAPVTFLFIHGIQKYSKLRYEEDFSFSSDAGSSANPATLLNNLICEGASQGIHVIASCDSYNNVNRYLSRKAQSEFEMRVLFQMSANDSASLIESPKASTLGLHRGLLYNSQEGYLELFRPYALPDREWIEMARENLARLLK